MKSYPNVQFIKSEIGETIYYLSDDTKKPFVSKEVFTQSGKNVSEIVTLNQIHMNAYKTGENITQDNIKQYFITALVQ